MSLILRVNGKSIAHHPTGAIINVSAVLVLLQEIATDECDMAESKFGHNAMVYKCGVREALNQALRVIRENQR